MGRRARKRTAGAVEEVPARRVVSQTARVRVDDVTWAEYRRLLGERSVAEALAAHVELEVARARGRRVSREELDERELVEVLERVEAATETLRVIGVRLQPRRPERGET